MAHKLVSMAIAYDFDGTLAQGNMQEHSFLPDIGMSPDEFWDMVDQLAKKHDADGVLTYMNLMLKKASEKEVPVRKKDFRDHGKSVKLFNGVKEWFGDINKYGDHLGLKVEHYIISSGLREMIEGTSIAHEFTRIYASAFMYDSNGVAQWPALAINFTTKTQYLFRINKGALNVYDTKKINQFVPMGKRPTPFEHMIFIGDSDKDIPCFSLVKRQGGHSIAVFQPKSGAVQSKAQKIFNDGRVNFIAPADYSRGSSIESIVKAIMNKIASDSQLDSLGKRDD
jgi:phosphoglycolate phosphatase-like HAD superfamily hydrolase